MMTRAGPHHTVTLVPGDGIGPEVTGAARRALDATGVPIEWEVEEAGSLVFQHEGTALPERVIESVRRTGVALKGPLATSVEGAYGSPSIALREALGLHTTIRPCRTLEGVRAGCPGVDVVIVKMNQEDLYARIGYARGASATAALSDLLRRSGHHLPEDAGVSIKPLSTFAARRVIKEAFELVRKQGRTRVTVVHKAPLMPETDGLFLQVAQEVSESYPDVPLEDGLVDTVCERLISRPGGYDVLVMPRMYGDIISGVATAMIGGAGLAPGVNVGDGRAVFEAAHGTAPRLAGTGRASPIALILTGAMLLRHLGERDAADSLDAAVATVIREGRILTYDLEPAGRRTSTTEVADAVIAELGGSP